MATEKVECECGCFLLSKNMNKHIKTKKHLQKMKELEPARDEFYFEDVFIDTLYYPKNLNSVFLEYDGHPTIVFKHRQDYEEGGERHSYDYGAAIIYYYINVPKTGLTYLDIFQQINSQIDANLNAYLYADILDDDDIKLDMYLITDIVKRSEVEYELIADCVIDDIIPDEPL
jgi:hypothetical protein